MKQTSKTTGGKSKNHLPKRILLPTDFSKISDNSVAHGAALAEQYGAEVILLHAVEPFVQPVEFIIDVPVTKESHMAPVEEAKKRLKVKKEALEARGIKTKVVVHIGKPWPLIVETAAKTKANLIVLPTHGHTGLKHALLGSTAERVVQHAPCSVLVVR